MGDDTMVVVIGAGPAGMSAGITVAQYGLPVTVIDEHETSEAPAADSLPALSFRASTFAWGLFPDNLVALSAGEYAESLKATAVIVATGGHERPVAFPGWTLPGVVTIGKLRELARQPGGLAGKRVLIAGTGPALLLAAHDVLEHGANIAALVEARPEIAPAELIRTFAGPAAFSGIENLDERLRRQGIPIYCQSTILSAQGDEGITSAVVTRLLPNGEYDPEATERIACDLICLHAGLSAAVELAQMVGCTVEYNVDFGGWYVSHDGEMRTSRDGIYVAGRVSGYAGHEISVASGQLAGLAVAHDLGALSEAEFSEAVESVKANIDALRPSSRQINTYSTMASDLSCTITPDTLLCPNEGVRAADIDRAISLGARTFNDIKRPTRCGMSECQARVCGPLVSAYMARQTGVSVESVELMTARPPIRPIPLIAIAALDQQLSHS